MSVMKGVKTYLISKGVSVPVFIDNIPEGETECIGLYRYWGQSSLNKAGIERVGLQVRCRSESYEEAIATAKFICSILWEIGDDINKNGDVLDIDGIKYLWAYPKQNAYQSNKENSKFVEVLQSYGLNLLP